MEPDREPRSEILAAVWGQSSQKITSPGGVPLTTRAVSCSSRCSERAGRCMREPSSETEGIRRIGVAIVGLGRAGRARLRALEGHPSARLSAIVGRDPGPGEPDLEAALSDAGSRAVIVCTPNLHHPEVVRRALAAEKHVLVEFPLAPTAAEARELFERALNVDRVLHVEHIELLSASQRAQRERLTALGRPIGGELRFAASSAGWVGEPRQSGSPALCAIARLHRLVDLFGEAEISSAQLLRPDGSRWRLVVDLRFAAGGVARLVEERGPERSRSTRWEIACQGGLLDDPAPASPGALFREDLDCFLARLAGRAEPYVSNARVLHVLELAGRIEALCGL